MEEWLFTEDLQAKEVSQGTKDVTGPMASDYHRGEHAPVAPHVQAIIILLEIYKKLRSFKVARGHPDVIFCLWVVEFG